MDDEDELGHRALVALQEAMDDPRWESIKTFAMVLDLFGGYPKVPDGDSSLYTLVAPDGVTVRVVDRTIPQQDLMEIVRSDVLHRLLREEHAEHIRRGMHLLDCMEILVPKFAHLKTKYRLEKLG